MPGAIIGGKEVEIPGVVTRNYKDDPRLALRVGRPDGGNDGRVRTRPVTLVVLHTTKGVPGGKDKREQVILPGKGPDTRAEERTAIFWSTDPQSSGAQIVIDHDCTVGILADLLLVGAYHAGQHEVNDRSIGIEIYQGHNAEMYVEQLLTVVKVVDFLTAYFGIQRQIPDFYRNKPVPRLEDLGGRDLYGVVGHRDVSDQRGKGDPGDAIMQFLEDAGYERFDFFAKADLTAWKGRQKEIRSKIGRDMYIDGIPGGQTNTALKELGYQHGLWALPPKSDCGPQLLEAMINAFYPTLLAAIGGSEKKALAAMSEWVAKRS